MKTLECPSCALETEAGLDVCPYCGYEFPTPRRGLSAVAWLGVLLMLLPLLWLALRMFGG